MALFSTTILQIRHGYCVVYEQPEYDRAFTSHYRWKLKQNFMEKKGYSGTITESTKKRIRRAIDLLLQISPEQKKFNPVTNKVIKHQLSFITLTITDSTKNYTAKESYKLLLAPFLKHFRDQKKILTYIWKAELQARGQVHYHITTPSILHYTEIKEYWNYLQRKAGMLKNFKAKFGHDNPNSTDIHAVKKINNIQAYLSKEFCKTVQNQTATTGKLWDCSTNLKGTKFFSTELRNDTESNIWRAHKLNHLTEVDLEQCIILKLKHMKSQSLLTPVDKKKYTDYIDSLKR